MVSGNHIYIDFRSILGCRYHRHAK
jgi:hypothetical protein